MSNKCSNCGRELPDGDTDCQICNPNPFTYRGTDEVGQDIAVSNFDLKEYTKLQFDNTQLQLNIGGETSIIPSWEWLALAIKEKLEKEGMVVTKEDTSPPEQIREGVKDDA